MYLLYVLQATNAGIRSEDKTMFSMHAVSNYIGNADQKESFLVTNFQTMILKIYCEDLKYVAIYPDV